MQLEDVYKAIVTPEFLDLEKSFMDNVKYFSDKEKHIKRAWKYAKKLNLDELPRKRILDIGTGFGYFPKICSLLGHTAEGTNLKNPLFNIVNRHMNVDACIRKMDDQRIFISGKYDIITAFQLCFHKNEGREWNAYEWEVFLRNAMDMLSKDGLLAFEVNRPRFLKEAVRGNYHYDFKGLIRIWK